jgi:hypoxanthine phosphoribosyltransferase
MAATRKSEMRQGKVEREMRCQVVSWGQFDGLVRTVACAIRKAGYQPDVVVAIARGGFVPARVLCDFLGVMELASFRIEHYQGQQMEPQARIRHPLSLDLTGKRVLVVDDLSDTGDTFALASHYLKEEMKAEDVRTAALHHKTQSCFEPDFYGRKLTKWRWISYPWARLEDIAALVDKLTPPPKNAEDAAARLLQGHGMRVSTQAVSDALALSGR